MYKQDLALNNHQRLISDKTQPNQTLFGGVLPLSRDTVSVFQALLNGVEKEKR